MRLRMTPLRALVLIVLAGVAGGTTVFFTARSISAADRAAIAAWEPPVVALVAEARARTLTLPSLAGAAGHRDIGPALLATRSALQDARNGLPEIVTPRILYPPTESFTIWIGRALDALAVVEGAHLDDRSLTGVEASRVTALLESADEHYRAGRDALVRLRCRARLPDCSVTSLPG